MSRETSFNPRKVELFTYDESTGKFKALGENSPIPVMVVGGELGSGNGGSGLNFLHGEGRPTQDFGSEGDVYLDKNDGTLLKKENGAWNILLELKGKDGNDGKTPVKGTDYTDGKDGVDGKTAYEIAVEEGFEGSQSAWLESLKGKDGENGTDGKDGVDGFVTEQMYNDLLNRVAELEGSTEE